MSYPLRADLKSCRLPIPALGLWLALLGPVYGQADDPRPSQSENPAVPERSEPEHDAAAMEEAEFRDAQNDAAMQEVIGGPVGVGPPQFASSFNAEALHWQAEFGQAILIAVNTDPVLNQQVKRLLQLKSEIENYQSPREQQRERRRAQRQSRRAADGD